MEKQTTNKALTIINISEMLQRVISEILMEQHKLLATNHCNFRQYNQLDERY